MTTSKRTNRRKTKQASSTLTANDVLKMWKQSELERRRWLLAEARAIERRWNIKVRAQDPLDKINTCG